jgi:hypothetical protein
MTSAARPTIPEVVARFAAYRDRPGNGAWGGLHNVLDDGNVDDANVEHCREWCLYGGDAEGEALCELLSRMSKTQRRKLPSAVSVYRRKEDS